MHTFTEEDVRRLLPMSAAVPLMRRLFEQLAAGEALNQPRRRLVLPTGVMVHQLAGSYGGYCGAKIYSSSRQGAHFFLLLFRATDGQPLAFFEANHLGQIRTGAATGLATQLLSPEDASTVALIGSGFQAETQLAAVAEVRRIREARVWSRSEEKRTAFARERSAALRIPVIAVASPEEAVRGAEIVITATSAREPVLSADWVAPGALVNGVGSNHPKRRELPPELVRNAALLVADSIEQARIEAGDFLSVLDEAGWQRVMELAPIAAGRTAVPAGTRVFKSLGLGAEDIAAAAHVYEASGVVES